MRKLRSAWGIVAGLVLLAVLLLVGGNAYVRWRMDQVDQGLFQLAAQLGYTPERFIRHEVRSRDVNIVTGSAYCVSELYFLTPMSVDEFGRRLDEVLPEPTVQLRVALPDPNNHLYSSLHLTANGVDLSRLENWDLQTPMTSYHGSQLKPEHNLSINFYVTKNISPTLAYGEHPIAGNLVRLYQEGGVFPFWVMCPGKTTDTPSAAVDLVHDAAAGRSVAMRIYYGALAAVGGLFVLMVALLVAGRVYGPRRVEQANGSVAALAQQLGYTPPAHLRHTARIREVTALVGSGECEAILVFTTPLSAPEFTARLNEVLPETLGQEWSDSTTDSLYALLDLSLEPSSQGPITMVHWFAKSQGTAVNFYDTGNARAALRQQARPIEGNVVALSISAGMFPVFMYCPTQPVDTPAPPFD